MDTMVRQEEGFGRDLGLVHEAVVTGRKVGVGKEFWSKLSHDQLFFSEVVKSLHYPVIRVIDYSQLPFKVIDRYRVDNHLELEFKDVLKASSFKSFETDAEKYKESKAEHALVSQTSTIRLYRFLEEVDVNEAGNLLYKPFNLRPATFRELMCLCHQYFDGPPHREIHSIASHYPLRIGSGSSADVMYALYRREPGRKDLELYSRRYKWPRRNFFACVEL